MKKHSQVRREELTVDEALTFWEKHKNKIWGIVLVVLGAFGANVDRFANLFPLPPEVNNRIESVEARVERLELKVKKLEAYHVSNTPEVERR